MYSPRSDEWERLPWLADMPAAAHPRIQPTFPAGWLATLMIAVAATSFWAGSTSIRAERRSPVLARQKAAAELPDDDRRTLLAVELLEARALSRRATRANAPY